MPKVCPKDVPEASWHRLEPQRDYAFRCGKDESVYFRFGLDQGVYLALSTTTGNVRVVYIVNYIDGELTLAGKIPSAGAFLFGRASKCSVIIKHAIISRQHLRMSLEGDILVVRDLASTNGTYCLDGSVRFDIESYLEGHPPKDAADSTLDEIHEMFGPTLSDFLKKYSQQKQKEQEPQ